MTSQTAIAVPAPNPPIPPGPRLYASSWDAGLRPPRRVMLPDAPLVERFSPELADRMRLWAERRVRGEHALQSAEDARPGGRDYVGALTATASLVRHQFCEGVESFGDEELSLAEFLRDEYPKRVARAVVAVAEADAALDELIAEVRDDDELRARVDAEVELWVREACRRVDSDAPGVVEQVEQENATEWAALAGLLAWLSNPAAAYRPRPAGRGDARVAEALAMSDLRHGRPVRGLPYRGTSNDNVVSDEVGPSGRYDMDGQVLVPLVVVEDPTPRALESSSPPRPSSPVEPKARIRWGRSGA